MKSLKFLKGCELEVCTFYNEATDEGEFENYAFKKDQVIDVDIFRSDETDTVDVQFADGSCIYSLSKDLFIIVE